MRRSALSNYVVNNISFCQNTVGAFFVKIFYDSDLTRLVRISQMAFSTVAELRMTITGLVIISLTNSMIVLPEW